ncbi:restriction endonuclease subunit S [Waltera acetigignens]|jgi:type I restriction enzyme S subunit|uniref:restriction endonuclease subunit S n=1 Tax=Waltera acetigignens TaxID=2981769 RepID=UPI0021D2A634|nr:restriction endonuclease subunit S [Brotolimicola acetigignens]MCU6760261.1 restriction endonuclease subunit S [Brotolimicola acetigignens]
MDTKALRQKILDLAIRGKLVPQDPSDEPASVLLERIREQKKQMVKEGKLKAKDIKNDTIIFVGEDNLHYEKFQDGSVKCIEDEIPFELPEGWAWCRLNSIVDVRDGTHDTPTYVDKGIPLITSKNLVEGGIDYSNVKYISEKDAISINDRSGVNIGDILFAMIGTIGNPSMVTEDILISIKNVALFKFTFSKNLSNHFVMYFLDYAQEDMKNKPSGGLQPFVSLNFLRTYLVPVPPVEEQQRIVSILADSINKIRNIDVLKNELTASVKKAKSKILDLAIRGKLVPQDPNDEPASVLLERIRVEKEELIKQGKIKRDKKESIIFRGDDNSYYEKIGDDIENIDTEIPFNLPDNWIWCRGCSCFSGMETTKPQGEFFDYIDIDSIDNRLHCIKKTKRIPVIEAPSRASRAINSGSVLFSLVRPYLENIALIEEIHSHSIASTGFYVCNSNGLLLPDYMFYLMISKYVVDGLNQYMKGDNSPSISRNDIENWLYPIPPIDEQRRICYILKTTFATIEKLEESLI